MALMIQTAYRASQHVDHTCIILGVRRFSTSLTLQFDQRWRAKKGLTANPNTFGPLTNLPDYSFKDGRPTPLGVRHRDRLEKQREYAERIIKLTQEIDYAVERHDRLQKEEAARIQAILDRKLKPKGQLLAAKQLTIDQDN
ncbi:39S ribosomal protein L52, mitochondrial isoform X2 [Neodiprion virginianus]|uniref:39S ribosomal protein L52, mitochondrial isoform X2 n=1 Tax=Neodiprion fabricii TaxID=2872261 RepID=UPI001ED8E71E|nr:39S ribosomal protein L52, mitochondrial isoform X2 [Neodiprion fabricii]XP_046625002.1 39S ribosomal protein L52, mitochondrial isoform X2 [Neodiprion virginianus]